MRYAKNGRGGRPILPYAFTEHGAVMAANILRSPKAIQMSVFVVRVIIRMRHMLISQKDLANWLSWKRRSLPGWMFTKLQSPRSCSRSCDCWVHHRNQNCS